VFGYPYAMVPVPLPADGEGRVACAIELSPDE
jgi:hypothetical protein